MGPARLQNNLDDAVKSAGGFSRFRNHPTIITKSMEAGDPGNALHAAIYWASVAAVARAALPPLKDAIIAWLKFRSDREIELQAGEYKVRIKGENDAENAIRVLEKMSKQSSSQTKNSDE